MFLLDIANSSFFKILLLLKITKVYDFFQKRVLSHKWHRKLCERHADKHGAVGSDDAVDFRLLQTFQAYRYDLCILVQFGVRRKVH